MIEVTSILVRSYDLDHLDLFWELNSQMQEAIEEYDFFILRSIDGFAGPYQQVAGPFYNTYQYRDPDVHRLHKWRDYFYKLKLVHRASGRVREYGPESLRAPPDRIALEIQRRECLLWREFAGRSVFLYPKLTFGQRCRHCWDEGSRGNTIGRAVQSNCATCYDTTFVGGFAYPIEIYAQIDPHPKGLQRTDLKEHQYEVTTARTIAYPPIKPGDMIVEAENKRWLVESPVSHTEKKRAVIRQELKLSLYSPDDIKHSVPVNADLQRLHNSKRSMTRPMCLDSRPDDPVEDKIEAPS